MSRLLEKENIQIFIIIIHNFCSGVKRELLSTYKYSAFKVAPYSFL